MSGELDVRDLQECLQALDRIIGDTFRDLKVDYAKEHAMVRVSAKCRSCPCVISEEACHRSDDGAPTGWAKRIIMNIISRVKEHGKKHQIIIARH